MVREIGDSNRTSSAYFSPVEQRGAVSINELTEILGVSHMTIRRDVSKLEEQGLLVSVSGGVRAVSRPPQSPVIW